VHDEERVMLRYPWPLQAVRRAELRYDAVHAMLVAWRSGVRHKIQKIQLANYGIAAVEKKCPSEELLLS
jgi:hypothetical protein